MGDKKSEWRHVTRADQLDVQRLFTHLPKSFEEKYAAMIELRALFHMEMAETMEPYLRGHLQAQPQDTLSERRALRATLNDHLHNLGLTLQCPSTGKEVSMELEFDERMRSNIEAVHDGKKIEEGRDPLSGKGYLLTYEDPPLSGEYVVTHRSEELPEINVRATLDWVNPSPLLSWVKDTYGQGKGR